MNWTPAAQITPLGCLVAFFSERLWLVLRILPPKPEVLKYLTNYVRVLDQAVSDYGMKMRVEPGVISKGVNNHHKAWNSVRKATHSTKENLKTFPCTMAELCQKLPVVLEINTEKNRYTEHELPVRYWLDHLFGMAAWAEPPALA